MSYAHGDHDDDERVATFFVDLSTEIRALTGDDQHEVVGFHDFRNLRAGDTWPRELIDALSEAFTFVVLCSPRYFRSRFCAKEWTVFARRVAAYERKTGRPCPSVIPVFWIWTKVPPGLGDMHHRDRSFGAAYEAEGLRELMRMERRREYNAFVRALAVRVRDVAEAFALPPMDDRPNFHAVPGAFGDAPTPAATPGNGAGDPPVLPIPKPRPAEGDGTTPPPPTQPPPRPILKLDTCDSSDPQ